MCRRGHEVRGVAGRHRESRYPAELDYDGVQVVRVALSTASESNDFREVVALKRDF